jgi:hypothetical protein
MIAYKKEWLDNLYMRDELSDAYYKNCLSKEEFNACSEKYPVKFYMPNFFVRIGLFILTVVIAIFSFGLISLTAVASSFNAYTVFLVLFAILSYAALELMVNTNHHYKSGVDDALMWMTAIFIFSAFNISNNLSGLQNSIIIFIIAFYFSLRFLNMLMSAIACIAFFGVIFFGYTKMGEMAKATVPFLIMIISAFVYFLTLKNRSREKRKHYSNCFLMIEIVCLVCMYVAGNYWVVREASISMFHLQFKENESIPFGWLFWIFTAIIPLIYITRGIIKKDIVLIRTGSLLIAATVFTVRYYYHLLPIETAMIIGGVILIVIAYALIKYLRKPKYGFTDEEINNENINNRRQLESLVIAQTFSQTQIEPVNQTTFGGGSGGGGGAGGEF